MFRQMLVWYRSMMQQNTYVERAMVGRGGGVDTKLSSAFRSLPDTCEAAEGGATGELSSMGVRELAAAFGWL